MGYSPGRITVKRRRDEEPVDSLYIQPKKYRPGAVWKLIEVGDANIQYASPTAAKAQPSQSSRSEESDPIAAHPKPACANTTNGAHDRHRTSDKPELLSGQEDYEGTRNVPNSSRIPAFETCAAVELQLATRVLTAPCHFHLLRDEASTFSPHSPFKSGVRKSKRYRKGDLAIFTGKAARHHASVRAKRALEYINQGSKGQEARAKSHVDSVTSRKRPIVTAAENARKGATQRNIMRRDDRKGSKKDGQSADMPSDHWDHGSEELAEQLNAIALAEIGAQEAGSLHLPCHTNLKFQPKPPKPRQQATQASGADNRGPMLLDTDRSGVDHDIDYVYDTYIKEPMSAEPNGLEVGELMHLSASLCGVREGTLIIEEEEEALWETFEVDGKSDRERNSEEDDENAEDCYWNDYPEDEVNYDDAYEEDAYNFRAYDSDDEEIDIAAIQWSEEEDT